MESPQVLFKQVVSRGCGLDVHKKVVVATIDGEGIKKQTQEFGTVTSSLKELRDWLLEYGVTYENALELLKKVPGISSKSVEDLVAEIGLDMTVFPTEKHLSSWAGMSPGNNESAGKKKRTNNPGKQASKSSTNRNCLGGNKDEEYIL